MNLISSCSKIGILVSPEINPNGIDCDLLMDYINSLDEKPFIINQEFLNGFFSKNDFFSKKLGSDLKVVVNEKKIREKDCSCVEVVKNHELNNKVKTINDWFLFYSNRFKRLKKMLDSRQELRNASSISSIKKIQAKTSVSTIVLIKEISKTANGHYIIDVEDTTGNASVFVSANSELINECENLVHDEVIGVLGSYNSNFIYASDFIFPEIPDSVEKKGGNDEYACFISDIHIGSIDFEKKLFENFIEWLKGNSGTASQKETAKKVKYLFIVGDLVDGVGVYPGQEKELEIKDIYKQYDALADYLKTLPEDIQIISIPGNHDALRQSEPQPPLFSDIAKPIYEVSNIKNLSNPCVVNIGKTNDFAGLNCLLYHGFTYTYYASKVPKLLNIGMDRPDSISEFLLKKRHLGPSHKSGIITPGVFDPLLIEDVPDVLATGHIHTLGYRNYKNVSIIAASCFQKMTSFMEKLGHHPTPGFVPLLNLKSREFKIMDFSS
ncbi:MAG: metallophosphoesterase [Candidatus Nanoarchaeia archaeon]|nr:metallophosphoesterase [Candidatus Nanoarchaeia archaeon]MDD5054033.1 metallophosphoesterase [Candidatus Nanoarchaeia archaeon]MDD5499400.1 metallophosphoesterase [Candidatus Nanoarchaeia archaeon]